MKQLFQKLFQSDQDEKDREKKPVPKKVGYIMILGLVGICFIIIGNVFSPSETNTIPENHVVAPDQAVSQSAPEPDEHSKTSDMGELEESYKQDLEDMLNKIQGVTEAEVMVNLDSTNVSVFEKNLIKGQQTTDESDRNGGTRKVEDQTEEVQTVLVRQGDREIPLLIQTKKPQVRGVFVVANGAEQASIKQWIVEAVSRVLDVPTHKVSVMPKN